MKGPVPFTRHKEIAKVTGLADWAIDKLYRLARLSSECPMRL